MKRLICIALTFALLCGAFVFGAMAAPITVSEIDSSLYYAKAELAKLNNGDALVAAYEKIEAGVKNCETKIDVYDVSMPITTDELSGVFAAFVNDQPQHFHLDRYNYSYSYYESGSEKIAADIILSYLITKEQYAAAEKEFEIAASRILADIPTNLSQYETELKIHDALVKHIDYTLNAENEHNAYGAIVNGKAVCDGYSKAFQYLLYQRGIQSTVVEGEVVQSDGSFMGHAWSLVRIDGKYYYTDVTHDDPVVAGKPKVQVFHNYFNITESRMLRDRTAYETIYPLPACIDTDDFYFNKADNKLNDNYSVNEVANKLAAGNGIAHIFADDADYGNWFFNNANSIYQIIGLSTAQSFSHSAIDGEFVLMLICPNDINVDGEINSADVLAIKQGLVGVSEFDEAAVVNGDTNGNGVLDSIDYLTLKLEVVK